MRLHRVLVLYIALTSFLNAEGMLTVTCDTGEVKKFQFFTLQEAREFMREECPQCVKTVKLERIDDSQWDSEESE